MKKAKEKQQAPKPCKKCPKSKRVDGDLYCTVNGKKIMPQFEDLCLCHGKLLVKRKEQNDG